MNYSEEDSNFYKKYPNGVKDPLHLFHIPIVNSNQEYENVQNDIDGILKEIKTSYKDVPIENGIDMIAMNVARNLDDRVSMTIAEEGYKLTYKYGIKLDKEKFVRWAKMCKFLEESATDEDRKNIGVLLGYQRLQDEIKRKDEYIKQLQSKISDLQLRIDDWGDDD